MKYDADFVAVVYLTHQQVGSHAAKRVFDRLFVLEKPSAFQPALDVIFGAPLDIGLIKQASHSVGKPGNNNAVPWIKEFRELAACGLKTAKDIHDFVRDNEAVHD